MFCATLKNLLCGRNTSLLSKFPSLGKETSTGEIPCWPSTSMWGGMPCKLDACGPMHGYGDTLKMLAALMCLFEEPCTVHCGQEGK